MYPGPTATIDHIPASTLRAGIVVEHIGHKYNLLCVATPEPVPGRYERVRVVLADNDWNLHVYFLVASQKIAVHGELGIVGWAQS